MKPDRLLCYMFLSAILDLTDSIPIILNLLTNRNIALIYSVTICEQQKKNKGLCTVRELPITGGHFACACVNPLNDNSVGASNLMAGNRKLARKITVLFVGALNTVLSYKKNIRHDKNRTFSTRVFTRRFFSSRFSWPFKDFQDSTPKSHVPV